MRNKPKNIQIILTFYFSISMLGLLVLFAVIFSIIQYKNIRANTDQEMQRVCSSIAEKIDLQIRKMDNVCMNTIHSPIIKDTFQAYMTYSDAATYTQIQQRNILASNMTAMKGVDDSIRQINMYSLEKNGFGTGNYTGYINQDISLANWYAPTKSMQGKLYIPPAAQNRILSSSAGTDDERYYLSIYRMYYDQYQNPAGFVEVMKYYDVLFDCAYYPESRYDLDITIYNADGDILFPLNNEETFPYLSYKAVSAGSLYNTEKRRHEYVFFLTLSIVDLR